MKKLFLMLAAGMMAASVNAQNTAITGNKAGDNWYIGLNAGAVSTPSGNKNALEFKGFAPNASIRLGKNFTTVFGLALEGTAYGFANKKSNLYTKTLVDAMDVKLLATANLSNAFCGYKGEPRFFEVIALGGFGWGHAFGGAELNQKNSVTSKAALDFAFNLGSDKAWQLYIEPNITYGLQGYNGGLGNGLKYNFNTANIGVNVGVNYKFGTSNGTHNFAKVALKDQAEIDGLNAKINDLRAESSSKDSKIAADAKTIADLKAQLAACQAQPKATAAKAEVKKPVETNLQPIVIFGLGKSTIDAAQYASVEMIAKYMRNHKDQKVLVRGYASPEGDPVKNQKLSEARAAAVKTALVKRYKIAADRIMTEGAGATDKLSSEIDFNRVAMFFVK